MARSSMSDRVLASAERQWLYRGEVLHRRLRPAANAFRYGVFYIKFPLHRLRELANPVFSVDRFNLLSFHQTDHGGGGDLQQWVQALLQTEGIDDADGEIWLQCFPRVLGYVFNPVSFWFCHRADGSLRAVVAEVNNTFGERHCYLLDATADAATAPAAPATPAAAAAPAASARSAAIAASAPAIRNGQLLAARKVFHVSPFCAIEGGYRFRFFATSATGQGSPSRSVARIDYGDAGGDLIHTSISGTAHAFTARALLTACARHPLMTFGVVARIYWQALRLWLKRVPFYRKPAVPAEFVTR